MASKSLTFKRIVEISASYFNDLKIAPNDYQLTNRYNLLVGFAGWLWLMKNKDLPALTPELEKEIAALQNEIKKASKAYG
jgi:hypothetical protein